MRVTWDGADPLIVERKAKREVVVLDPTAPDAKIDHLGVHPTTKIVDGMDRWCVGCAISAGVTHFMTDDAEMEAHLGEHVRVEEEAAKLTIEHDAHELVIDDVDPPAPAK